jgi:hypothetical protein
MVTRSRSYHKNDNEHVEQCNWTHVRQHFGYERYDNPAVVPLINHLCNGSPGQLQNHFLPTHKLLKKQWPGRQVICFYGPAKTPYARGLAAAEVSDQQKSQLQELHTRLNPIQLQRDIQQQQKQIQGQRLLQA